MNAPILCPCIGTQYIRHFQLILHRACALKKRRNAKKIRAEPLDPAHLAWVPQIYFPYNMLKAYVRIPKIYQNQTDIFHFFPPSTYFSTTVILVFLQYLHMNQYRRNTSEILQPQDNLIIPFDCHEIPLYNISQMQYLHNTFSNMISLEV